jgi:hypothetical protein
VGAGCAVGFGLDGGGGRGREVLMWGGGGGSGSGGGVSFLGFGGCFFGLVGCTGRRRSNSVCGDTVGLLGQGKGGLHGKRYWKGILRGRIRICESREYFWDRWEGPRVCWVVKVVEGRVVTGLVEKIHVVGSGIPDIGVEVVRFL